VSASLADRAREKELLLMRSALCRLRLHRGALELRDSLHWRRAAAAASAPAARSIAFGLALALAGFGRTARMVRLAGRVVLIAGVARAAVAWARAPAATRSCASVQTGRGTMRSLDGSTRSRS
jgi:hypothetical protein